MPPRFATWLLERLAPDERRDSLIGDLIERYRNGNSASWYWRQALGAIVFGNAKAIGDHKLLALRAVLVGFASMWVFSAAARFLLQVLWVFASGGVYLGGHWVRLDYGWIRNRMYIAFVLTLLGSAASGWIVGRLHRERQTAMVLVYLASAIVVAGVQLAVQVRLIEWTIRPVAQYPQTLVLFFVLVPAAILLGGLWRRTRPSIRYGTSTTGARQNATF
jgi:hypothetical protein